MAGLFFRRALGPFAKAEAYYDAALCLDPKSEEAQRLLAGMLTIKVR